MNHRFQKYKTELEAALRGTVQADNIIGTHKAYHFNVGKEYEKIMEDFIKIQANELGIEVDTRYITVVQDLDYDGKVDIKVELSHKLFKDLSEETKGKRMELSHRFYDVTGMWIPIEVMTVKRIVLELKFKP